MRLEKKTIHFSNFFRRVNQFEHFSTAIIDEIENLKINPTFLFIYFIFLFFLREALEQSLLSNGFAVVRFVHHLSFGIFTILSGILLISFIGRINIEKTTLIVSSGFFVIVIPPLIDRFIFERDYPYEYLGPDEFFRNFFSFFHFTNEIGIGILVEILAIMILASFYVLLKSKSLGRALGTAISLYGLIGVSGTPGLFFPFSIFDHSWFFLNRHLIFFLIFFVLSSFLVLIFLFKINPKLPWAVASELCSLRTLHFILMVFAGSYFMIKMDFLRFPGLIFALVSIILISIMWLSTVLLNHVFDLDIDRISNRNRPLVRGEVTRKEYLHLGLILTMIALFISLVLGIIPFLLSFLFLLSSILYSTPPFRFRTRLFSTAFIGWGSVLAFLLGYWNQTKVSGISITSDVLKVLGMIFFAFSIGPLTKDLKDYRGDLQNGVKTFFTVYGFVKGKKIVSFLLAMSLMTPLFLFQKATDIIFFLVVSLSVSCLFFYREKPVVPFIGYGMAFCFCGFRIVGIF